MFSVISPVSSLYVRRGGETGEIFSSAAPVSFLPGLLIFGLRGREVI